METRTTHRETAEELRMDKQRSNQHKQREHLFHRLNFDKHNYKLSAADVLQITKHPAQSNECCAEEELITSFINKLMIMNYRARYIKIKDNNEDPCQQGNYALKHKTDSNDFLKYMFMSKEGTNQCNQIHAMDVQMAVFHCADGFLKQLMVTKLSQCQFALPLLVPDPDTQQIEFPLWTFRQINKSWKMRNNNNETISHTQPIYNAETPMVFFFRFGSVSSSKSQLMNSLINEKHNTFFHRNCPGSSKTRVLMDGVVEIAWFCPSGINDDKFSDCVAFCNLHGDAGDHEKQLKILTEMATVNIVLLPQLDRNDRCMMKLEELYKRSKPLICLFAEDVSAVFKVQGKNIKVALKDRNQADVSEELIRAINYCLSESSSTFRLEDVSKHPDIRVDEEDDEDCRRGREGAQQIMDLLKKKKLAEIKESFLPHQGKLWHQWSQRNRELHRPQGNKLEIEISEKQTQIKNIRQKQYDYKTSQFLNIFLEQMNSHVENQMYFFKWLRILLDEFTSADLYSLHHKYDETWSKLLKNNTDEAQQLTEEQSKLERISEELQAAAFGVEHIMREIGQIYESCSSVKKNKKDLQVHFSSLPSLAAQMMISGFPLELMDGDSAHVPVVWISAVLDKLIQKLGDQRFFVLSVIGIQSSGKSTMLNAMFGLQFAVSAGRCTRGAFMQLVKVSDEMKTKMNIDFILVVDTEGLRALEPAGRSTRHHDNELATFVVGLANLTLINIFGENLSEMQDILQIIVQAFLRMKKVRLNPSCVFVHQNVSEITAGEKNMEGRRRLLEKLDEMTKLAAKEEVCNVERFSDVIRFDVQKDVKYFAHLWEGSPPMAPPNPKYSTNIQELKTTVLSKTVNSRFVKLSEIKGRINDLWNALLNENFVFSFKNILEIAVYRRLETRYNDWTWQVRSSILKIEEKIHNRIENGEDEVFGNLLADMAESNEAVQRSIVSYFEEDRDKEILSQWRGRFETKIKELYDDLIKRAKKTSDEMIQQKKAREKLDAKKTEYENKLYCLSKELALKLKSTESNEKDMTKEFDSVWSTWITELIKDPPPVTDIDFWSDATQILSEKHEMAILQKRKQEKYYKNINCRDDYSDYIVLQKNLDSQEQSRKHTDPNSIEVEQENISGISFFTKTFAKAFYKAAKCRQKEDENKSVNSQSNVMLHGNALLPEDHDSLRVLIKEIKEQMSTILQQTQTAKVGYHNSYIQKMTACVQNDINTFKNKNKKFKLKKEFTVDLCLHVCDLAHNHFKEIHKEFKNANDPRNYLEKQKPQYYSVFMNYCGGLATTRIFAKFIGSKLKSSILQAVYNKTAFDLADRMKSDIPALNGNRSKLEKHILKSLAEKEDFEQYMDYIHNPRNHFKRFIMCEVKHFINQHQNTVLDAFIENVRDKIQTVWKAVHRSIEDVKRKKGDAEMWQKIFTETLTNELKFTGNPCVELSEIADFDFLENFLSEDLKESMSNLLNGFNSICDLKMEMCRKKPDTILIDHFCRCCWVQCPFCEAICTNTIPNHHGDHSVPFHRVIGLNGVPYRGTANLSLSICTSSVASDRSFYPKGTDDSIRWNEYRKAKGVYANWSITPDLSELPYWKWVMCRFQKDLEKSYNKTFEASEIPEEWRNCSKEDALKSLDEYI